MDHSKKIDIQVEPRHYFSRSYDVKERFISYWHQINEVIVTNPSEVLEIGVGNGLVSTYLRERGYKLTTLDVDARLKPDVAGNILSIPLYMVEQMVRLIKEYIFK